VGALPALFFLPAESFPYLGQFQVRLPLPLLGLLLRVADRPEQRGKEAELMATKLRQHRNKWWLYTDRHGKEM